MGPPIFCSLGNVLVMGTSRKRGCKECIGCKREDCGSCRNCKDMTKFGGKGKKKQKCIHRVCTGTVKVMFAQILYFL